MVLYLDTETTGLHPGNICQLSYILQSGNRAEGRNLFFTVDSVELGALMVHGLTVEKLKELSKGQRFWDVIDIIEEDFSKASMFCAHNTAFDFKFLRSEFDRSGKGFMVKKEFCTMKNSIEICKLKRPNSGGYKYPKLSELCEFFGISDEFILSESQRLFFESGAFHDARFDTTALYLCANAGIRCGLYKALEENI